MPCYVHKTLGLSRTADGALIHPLLLQVVQLVDWRVLLLTLNILPDGRFDR
jgi:hypothetical protein